MTFAQHGERKVDRLLARLGAVIPERCAPTLRDLTAPHLGRIPRP
jgi:hypothetical protein